MRRPVDVDQLCHGTRCVDRLKDRGVILTIGSQADPSEIAKAEMAIKELLAEHGHKFAVVQATYEELSAPNAVRLVFTVDEGRPKPK
jgi:outer membrane protein insertion porin family